MSSACVYLVYIPLLAFSEDGGWWRSWLQQSYQNVREKSVEALEFIKRDLTEFSQVVQHDTASTIAATASVVKEKLASEKTEGTAGTTEKVKKGLSDFLGVISDTFAPSPDKTIDCDVITLMGTPSGTTEPYDSTKARLYSLQSDPATYCNEPDEEFLGMTALSQLNLKHLPEKDLCAESQVKEQSSPSQSSDSTSPVTQIANPVAPTLATATGSQRLPEASAEDQQFVLKMAEAGHGQPDYQVSPLSSERLGVQEQSEAKAFSRTEALKLEGPTDLRVFELNSDSGKSTPSNNGKKGSSTDISEDWEKDFDLDMTEEEVQLVLSKVEVAGELEDEDWEDWE
ncbi:BSD domain-containing protein 1-like isoform X6 [Rhinatrema bivittatum]|uniref:BSD domain-containing protein 1-like isoform X6 n=1 Tax=Rhinatrema bivittatum TaxID=194408 RepID=UPI00112E1125|nr:BSD domain-containing protein 1-like isoform X6 [Rhinatrema bivittatum]